MQHLQPNTTLKVENTKLNECWGREALAIKNKMINFANDKDEYDRQG